MASPSVGMITSKFDEKRCPDNPGIRGPPFRRWMKDWKEHSEALFGKEDDNSYYQVCMETDQGSTNGPDLPNGGGPLLVASRLRRKRQL